MLLDFLITVVETQVTLKTSHTRLKILICMNTQLFTYSLVPQEDLKVCTLRFLPHLMKIEFSCSITKHSTKNTFLLICNDMLNNVNELMCGGDVMKISLQADVALFPGG